jgi:Prenyltransferase and squalene oxidase repeat
VGWLRDNQNSDGGFGARRGQSSNSQSTAYAVQGLVAVGARGAIVPRALRYLTGLQRPNGSVRYSRTSSQTPVWVTAQALMALKRKPLPVAPVQRRRRAAKKSAAAPVRHARKRPKPHSASPDRAAGAASRAVAEARPAPRVAAARKSKVGPVASTENGPPLLLLGGAAAAAILAVLFFRRRLRS